VTGSGKTLAFGIPMVQRLLVEREEMGATVEAADDDDATTTTQASSSSSSSSSSMGGLVLAPTRELALQIVSHLGALIQGCSLRVVALVGGMSKQKQERLLKQRPEIVVATPGRFWELLQQGETWLRMHRLRFFVVRTGRGSQCQMLTRRRERARVAVDMACAAAAAAAAAEWRPTACCGAAG
jgi:ATP-dependent RNA helicase DDX24/MAK5